jgi:hypothetical protein
MSTGKTQHDPAQSQWLTFRQKFWLFGVGVPVLLLVGLLVLLVFLPRPLNPTEQKLLGRWEFVDPPSSRGVILEFRDGYIFSSSSPTPALWKADEDTFSFNEINGDEYSIRFKSAVGLSEFNDRARIESLSEDEFKIRFRPHGQVLTLKRVESRKP